MLHINVDRFNAQTLRERSDWSVDQAVGWAEAVHRDLVAALKALPDERLFGGRGRHGARMWFWMPAFIHSGGHRRTVARRIGAGA